MAQEHTMAFFPRFIDRPRLVGIFEIDEFFIAFGLMASILGISLAFPNIESLYVMVTAITVGVGSAVGFRKFKRGRPDGYTIQKAYRSGLFSPGDDKKAYISYPYLSRITRIIPFGFTKEFYS